MKRIVVRTNGQLIMTILTCGVAKLIQVNDTTYRYIDVWGDGKTFRVRKGSEVTLAE